MLTIELDNTLPYAKVLIHHHPLIQDQLCVSAADPRC